MVWLSGLPASAVTLEWVRQFGTPNAESASAVAADGIGNVYVGGGGSNGTDGEILRKYNAAGTLLWETQSPYSAFASIPQNIALDGLGNVYVAGYTTVAGVQTGYVKKYDSNGALLWGRPRPIGKHAYVAVDGLGNVFVGYGDYLDKYNADDGGLLWSKQMPRYFVSNTAADSFGNVYVTSGATIYKYDSAGNLLWSAYSGDQNILGEDTLGASGRVSTDKLGDVYCIGSIFSTDHSPVGSYLAKLDNSGNRQWFSRLDTIAVLSTPSVGLSNVYLTSGNFLGSNQRHFAKFNAAGELSWVPFGAANQDFAGPVSADGLGNVYLAGATYGDLGGPNAGSSDAFIAKFNDFPIPEPRTILLAGLALAWVAALGCRTAGRRSPGDASGR